MHRQLGFVPPLPFELTSPIGHGQGYVSAMARHEQQAQQHAVVRCLAVTHVAIAVSTVVVAKIPCILAMISYVSRWRHTLAWGQTGAGTVYSIVLARDYISQQGLVSDSRSLIKRLHSKGHCITDLVITYKCKHVWEGTLDSRRGADANLPAPEHSRTGGVVGIK